MRITLSLRLVRAMYWVSGWIVLEWDPVSNIHPLHKTRSFILILVKDSSGSTLVTMRTLLQGDDTEGKQEHETSFAFFFCQELVKVSQRNPIRRSKKFYQIKISRFHQMFRWQLKSEPFIKVRLYNQAIWDYSKTFRYSKGNANLMQHQGWTNKLSYVRLGDLCFHA